MANKRFLHKFDSQKIWWLHFIKYALLAVVAVVLVFTLVIGVSRVSGQSMLPTLQDGSAVVYLRLTQNYAVGDVVSVHMSNGERYIKRVVAVAGDTVDLRDGVLYVNGAAEAVSYAHGETNPQSDAVSYPLTLRQGQVFLLGDNRPVSVDSRTFGAVNVSQIQGRVLAVD